MPATRVVFFKGEDGTVPFLTWLAGIPEKAQDKCVVRIERLAALGYELRRPEADFLRDDIFELRAKHLSVNYRVLYFFHGPSFSLTVFQSSKIKCRLGRSRLP